MNKKNELPHLQNKGAKTLKEITESSACRLNQLVALSFFLVLGIHSYSKLLMGLVFVWSYLMGTLPPRLLAYLLASAGMCACLCILL